MINTTATVVWLGCIGQSEAFTLPLLLARTAPEMTVIAAHACDSHTDSAVTAALKLQAIPRNLLLARGGAEGPTFSNDDEIMSLPAAWQAANKDSSLDAFRRGGCDWLLLTEGALGSLASLTLPSIAEGLLGRALLWCDTALLPADQDVGAFWRSFGRSKGLINAALATVAHRSIFRIDTPPSMPGLLHVMRVGDHALRHQALALEAIRTLGVMPHDAMITFGHALEQRGMNALRTGAALTCAFAASGDDRREPLAFNAGAIEPFLSCSLDARRTRASLGYARFDLNHSFNTIGVKALASAPLFPSFTRDDKYISLQLHQGLPSVLFAKLASEEMTALRTWWPSLKTALDPLRSMRMGVVLIGSDLGMVAIKAARFAPAATVINWRGDSMDRLSAVIDLSKILASRRVIVGSGTTKISLLRTLAGPGGPVVVAIGASMIVRWLAATKDDVCDTVALEVRLGAAIDIGQRVALVELPRLDAFVAGLHELAPACAAALDLAYAGDELTLLRAALQHVTRRTSHIELSVGGTMISEPRVLLAPAEVPLVFRIEFEARSGVSRPNGISVAAAIAFDLMHLEKAALLRAHLRLPLDHLDSGILSEAPDLLSTDRLSLTVIEGVPALMVNEGINALLWPIISTEPWDSPRGVEVWDELEREMHASPAEHRGGRFSLLEFGCRDYSVALHAASKYPNATVLSIVGVASLFGDALYNIASGRKLQNVLCCAGEPLDDALAKKFYESPELARFALLQSPSLLDGLAGDYGELKDGSSHLDFKKALGRYISSSLTTWLPFPSVKHISLAMLAFFPETSLVDAQRITPTFSINEHPVPAFMRLLQETIEYYAIIPLDGETRVSIREAYSLPGRPFSFPLVRLDIVKMTRKVHHHFDWAKDGHKRTYTMHVDVNTSLVVPKTGLLLIPGSWRDPASGGGAIAWNSSKGDSRLTLPVGHHVSEGRVVHVRLTRDHDAGYIPYGVIHSFTLICALRLGLVKAQTSAIYRDFVKLPLYEDMAPWNIALAAGSVEYIDYDTRGRVYDAYVRESYRVLSVLMNYKRTVSDFGMCGESAHNPYGFGQVSSCVKPRTFDGSCDKSEVPVPCDDGNCHSDYISCLRALVNTRQLGPDARNPTQRAGPRPMAGVVDLRRGF